MSEKAVNIWTSIAGYLEFRVIRIRICIGKWLMSLKHKLAIKSMALSAPQRDRANRHYCHKADIMHELELMRLD
ncbi:hypothetical protein [Colwellia sp. Bg11-28]|uniref:hypothetical protein n=1 Tax=Colwellia sp. Bg11-28 TaxID=2058305 RepID=UPI000C3378C2|nr:hypothetical protein [Colwellia sp. Bg11-28]PKH87241.1 hypothetical protein CXF79_11170 [Colwellia sp. Bg11-28]